MQDHQFDFVVDGTPEEVWDVVWKRMRSRHRDQHRADRDLPPRGTRTVTAWFVTATFPFPSTFSPTGKAQSWEWITESKRPVSWRYDAIGEAAVVESLGMDTTGGPGRREDEGLLP